jgi:SOR/SNZ family
MGINDKMAVHTEKPSSTNGIATTPDFTVKAGLAQMLKGGVIMDVVNADQVLFSSHPYISDVFLTLSCRHE